MYRIGVDIGGMSIKVGIVDESGSIIKYDRFKTVGSPDEIIENLACCIEGLLKSANVKKGSVKGIGIGCPGIVSSKTGVVDYLTNMGWKNVPLGQKLKDKVGLDVVISNDANVATLAEIKYGAAKGFDSAVMFTLGTGVGGGIVIDGKLYEGGHSHGTELGHITLVKDGLPCGCGRRGCLECYVSATALMRQTKEVMLKDKDSLMWKSVDGDIEKVSGATAFDCEKLGDKSAKAVVDTYVSYLADGMMSMFNICRPDVFIIGGGVSAQGKNLTDRLDKYCKKYNYGIFGIEPVKIVTATLGNDAGIVGAACLIEC